MFCTNCGAPLEPNAKFCCFCGMKLMTAPSVFAQQEETPPIEQETATEQQAPMEEAQDVAPAAEPIAEEPIFEPTPQPEAYAPYDQTYQYDDLTQPTDAEPTAPKKKKSKLIPILMAIWVALIGTAAALDFTGALDSFLGKGKAQEEDISGYYVLQTIAFDGSELVESWQGPVLFIEFNQDGTAVFFNGTALVDSTYKNGELKLPDGTKMAYRVKKEILTLTTAEGNLSFRKSEEAAPDYAKLEALLAKPLEVGYFKLGLVLNGDGLNAQVMLQTKYESFLILYEDGTGVTCMGDKIIDVCWGDGLISPIDQKDDVATYTIDIDSFNMQKDGYRYVFLRSEEAHPDVAAIRKELDAKLPGYYLLTKMTNGKQTIDVDDIFEMAGRDPIFILIYEDGTAVLNFSTGLQDMLWDETHIYPKDAVNEKAEYKLEGDALTLEAEGLTMIFERSDETPPDIDAMREESEKPTPSDIDLTGEYALYAYDMGSGMTETSGATLSLNSDGTGIYAYSGTQLEVTWSAENVKVGTIIYTYEVTEDGAIVMKGSDGTFYFRPVLSEESCWSNDWYGFWIVSDCTGEMKKYDEMWWDLCARSTDNGDGTCKFIFWDEDYNSVTDPLGEVVFKILENDELQSSEGYYYYDKSTESLTTAYAYAESEDMIVLEGTYSDSERSFTYTIYLRPWGARWDDLDEDWEPYYYDEWYLPLIEADESLPDVFELP